MLATAHIQEPRVSFTNCVYNRVVRLVLVRFFPEHFLEEDHQLLDSLF